MTGLSQLNSFLRKRKNSQFFTKLVERQFATYNQEITRQSSMNVPGNQFDENLSWKENSKFLENKTAKNIAKDSLLALYCSYSHC